VPTGRNTPDCTFSASSVTAEGEAASLPGVIVSYVLIIKHFMDIDSN